MEIRPILSTLARHKTAAALIVIEIALTCAIICNALFMIGDRVSQINEPSGIAENELLRIQLVSSGTDTHASVSVVFSPDSSQYGSSVLPSASYQRRSPPSARILPAAIRRAVSSRTGTPAFVSVGPE